MIHRASFIIIALIFALCTIPALAAEGKALVVEKAHKEAVLIGFSRAVRSMEVSSEVSGRVKSVGYDVGDVAGGRPFIEIDTIFIDLETASLKRQLEKLAVSIRRAESSATYLQKEFERLDGLYKGDRVTGQRRDAAEEEARQAQLEIDTLKADEASLEVQLSELQERRTRHFIYIPKGWTVTGRGIEPGEVIQPGAPLGSAGDFRELVVPIALSGLELEGLRDLPKEFSARLDGQAAKAKVRFINPDFNEQTRKTGVELLITSYSGPVRGGLRFELRMSVPDSGVLIPATAVTERYGSFFVVLKDTGERVTLLVLDRTPDGVIAAQDPKLVPGTELKPAEAN